jgi:hypothetical protein
MCVSVKRCFRLRARSTRWNSGDGEKAFDIISGLLVFDLWYLVLRRREPKT